MTISKRSLVGLFHIVALGACSDGGGGNHPPPRVIAGGGIGDGPIDGVVNVYVVDDVTRAGVAGATVTIGGTTATTDADGLAILTTVDGHAVHGPQDVTVAAAGYRPELWLDADGANLTFDLRPPTAAVPAHATFSGSIANLGDLAVAAGHVRLAVVTYLQRDDLGDAANSIATPNNGNACISQGAPASACTYTIDTRTGAIGLLALVFDRDLHGTPTMPGDDTMTLAGYAVKTGLTATADTTTTGTDLTLVPAAQLATETVDLGTPPSGLATASGIVGIETADGVFQLPLPVSSAAPSLLVPTLAAVGATGYRLTGIAENAAQPPTQSIVLRRAQTAATLSAGAWLAPPTDVSVARAHVAFAPVADATVHGLELTDANGASVGNVTFFDPTRASADLPAAFALPAGALTAKLSAIAAPGLDVTAFALDDDRAKLVEVAATPTQVAD